MKNILKANEIDFNQESPQEMIFMRSINFISIFCIIFAFSLQVSALSLDSYHSTDEIYYTFKNTFPQIQILQLGNLTTNQKKLVNIQFLNEFVQKYDNSFLRKISLKKIIIVSDPNYYCREVWKYEFGPCPSSTAGWAPLGGEDLYLLADKSENADLVFSQSEDESAISEESDENAAIQNSNDYEMDEYKLKIIDRRRHVAHHELFHSIDSSAAQKNWEKHSPPQWTPGPKVGGSGFDENLQGFASNYGASNVMEDRAEIYAHMLKNHEAMIEKSKRDPYLKNKILSIKHFLLSICKPKDKCEIPLVFHEIN